MKFVKQKMNLNLFRQDNIKLQPNPPKMKEKKSLGFSFSTGIIKHTGASESLFFNIIVLIN